MSEHEFGLFLRANQYDGLFTRDIRNGLAPCFTVMIKCEEDLSANEARDMVKDHLIRALQITFGNSHKNYVLLLPEEWPSESMTFATEIVLDLSEMVSLSLRGIR